MNQVFLYTIWQRVEDLIPNPALAEHILEPGATGLELPNESGGVTWHDAFILDPNNASGTRYVAIKCVDNLDVAKTVCEASNGQWVYTYQQAWFGMSD